MLGLFLIVFYIPFLLWCNRPTASASYRGTGVSFSSIYPCLFSGGGAELLNPKSTRCRDTEFNLLLQSSLFWSWSPCKVYFYPEQMLQLFLEAWPFSLFLSACMFIRGRADSVLGLLHEIIAKGKKDLEVAAVCLQPLLWCLPLPWFWWVPWAPLSPLVPSHCAEAVLSF